MSYNRVMKKPIQIKTVRLTELDLHILEAALKMALISSLLSIDGKQNPGGKEFAELINQLMQRILKQTQNPNRKKN